MVHRKEMHMTESFGERIKRLRIRKNLNQNQVAIALQVTGKAISNYENNLRQPSLETLVRMANLYRVSIDYLLGQDHSESINTEGLTEKEVTDYDIIHLTFFLTGHPLQHPVGHFCFQKVKKVKSQNQISRGENYKRESK